MMLRRLFWAAFAFAAVLSCGKNEPQKEPLTVVGKWELTSVQTKSATVGGTVVDIYIDFGETNFTLYQKVGEGRYTQFTGTYKLGEDDSLSGTYSSGASWGPWAVVREENTLSLTKNTETDTYKIIEAIPDSVLKNLNL